MSTATTLRPFPFAVRPNHLESLDSYTARVLAANFEPMTLKADLLRDFGPLECSEEERWVRVLATKTGRVLRFPHLNGPAHDDGTSCARCDDLLPVRRACTQCSLGETVLQAPNFGSPVCARHRRWVGLADSTAGQRIVGEDHVIASRRFDRLTKSGRVDMRLYLALTNSAQKASPNSTEADIFPIVMTVAQAITERRLLVEILNPTAPYAESFATLVATLTRVVGEVGKQIARDVWLYLRSTAAAVYGASIGMRHKRLSWHEFPLDETSIKLAIGSEWPPQAFSAYLAASNDTLESARAYDEGRFRVPSSSVDVVTCGQGHQYSPGLLGQKCPHCNFRGLVPGRNDLVTMAPAVAREFDIDHNGGLTPDEVPSGSGKRLWWRCPSNHTYQATPSNRTLNRQGCPVCLNRIIQPGANDFATLRPTVAAHWHPANSTSPTTHGFAGSSGFAWLCEEGHVEHVTIARRLKVGCKTCGAAAKASIRTLADSHPELRSQWHPTDNAGRRPEHFTAGSHQTAYWLCDAGHSFLQRIDRRVAGSGCKYCKGRAFKRGFNDLATTDPLLTTEWHPSKNILEPVDTKAADRPFWWRCSAGHDYRQTVTHRRLSRGCPNCPKPERVLAEI